jgi:hypothetical protein
MVLQRRALELDGECTHTDDENTFTHKGHVDTIPRQPTSHNTCEMILSVVCDISHRTQTTIRAQEYSMSFSGES